MDLDFFGFMFFKIAISCMLFERYTPHPAGGVLADTKTVTKWIRVILKPYPYIFLYRSLRLFFLVVYFKHFVFSKVSPRVYIKGGGLFSVYLFIGLIFNE